MKRSRTYRWMIVSSFLLSVVLLNLPSCEEASDKKKEVIKNSFVGSTTCASCHTKAYESWNNSHHDWAMKLPDPATVLGDFNNVRFESDGVSYFFSKQGEKFLIRSTEIDGSVNTYQVAYTFGVSPLQQYLIKFPKGKFQVLRASWDTENLKWFHQYPGDELGTGDWLHWTKGGQRWNTMCAECHSTNLKKNYDLKTDAFETTFDEINVGCESCHGAGKKHVVWANDEYRKGHSEILVDGKNQENQLDACAGCHARRVKLTETMKAERRFNSQFLIQNITNDFYHSDGQILEEDYVFGSFLQSKMYKKNVKCSDCHDPHSLELKRDGNLLCMECHDPEYNTSEHHFHALNTKESMCINCHMTGRTYMGNDFRRDHSFRVPRPDQSVLYNTPNACTGCHSEKSDQWAADWVVKWFGSERALNYTDKLLMTLNEEISREEYEQLLNFISDYREPAIARSTVMEYLPPINSELEFTAVNKCLKDSSPIVRYNALAKMTDLPLEQRQSITLKHISDESKLVRIAAARLIVESSIEDYSNSDRASVRKARNELEEMLFANADFPLGRLQLGDYYFRQNLYFQAIEQYEMAIEMDSLLAITYPNLATVYNLVSKDDKALSTLDQLIIIAPENARAFYLRGLLNHEMGDDLSAFNDLKKAVELDPDNERYQRNLSNIMLEINKK